jgi:hypothetical protein
MTCQDCHEHIQSWEFSSPEADTTRGYSSFHQGGPGGPLTRNLQLSSCWLPATGNKLLSDVHRLPPAKTIRVEKGRKGLSTPTISLCWSEDAALVFFEIFFLRIQDMGTCSLDWQENHKYWHSKGASSTKPSQAMIFQHAMFDYWSVLRSIPGITSWRKL